MSVVRESTLAMIVVGLVMALAAPVRISDRGLPTPPSMMTFVAGAPPVRLHAGMAAPQKIVDRAPDYPAGARAAGVSGVVVLEIVIDASGEVQTVHVLRSIPALDLAAIDAARQWRFVPTLVNGEPVSVITTVSVTFALKSR
jgi:protein TonB